MEQDLLELEQQGWQALSSGRGAEFYDAFMTDEAVMALPFGVLERDDCVEAIRQADPWATFEIRDARVVPLNEDAAIVVYIAAAQREANPEYVALMSTTYVRRDGEWLIALHQQTPLIDAGQRFPGVVQGT